MTDLKDRLRLLRKTLNLSQSAFGEKIGVQKSAISFLEAGKTNLTDSNALLICREFNVNSDWLRTGKGEMFKEAPASSLDILVNEYNLTEMETTLLKNYLKLSESQRATAMEWLNQTFFAANMAAGVSPNATNCDTPGDTVPAATL